FPASQNRASAQIPMFFVHGQSHEAWYWTNFLDYFTAHGYAAYALNRRGHGGSDGRERLRHVPLAKWSGKTAVEYEQHVGLASKIGEADGFASEILQTEIRGRGVQRYFRYCDLSY
ncbi:MAG TPA: alpha/beta fold hydrolase, partial [Anaerolineales bacterium]